MKRRVLNTLVVSIKLRLKHGVGRRESWNDMLRGFDKQANNRIMRQAMQEEALYELQQARGL